MKKINVPHKAELRLTDSEREFLEKLLPILRRPAPRNGGADIVIITRHERWLGISDTTGRGRVALRR
jgi:hypothetical protein